MNQKWHVADAERVETSATEFWFYIRSDDKWREFFFKPVVCCERS